MILRPVEAGVAHGPAYDEAAGGIHVDLGIVSQGHALAGEHRLHHVLDHLVSQALVLDVLGMLGGHDHLLHRHRLSVHVANRHLGLAVGAQVGHLAGLAHRRQLLGHAMGQIDGHGHKGGGLVAGVAEHHALVAGADALVGIVGALAALGLPALVDAHGDVRRLLVDGVDHAACFAVETKLRAVVADLADHVAHDAGNVHVSLGANLAGHHDHAGGGHGLASAADLSRIGRMPVGGDVAGCGQLGLLGQNGVQDGVGNLVADLVGMSLGNGFRGEQVALHSVCHRASSFIAVGWTTLACRRKARLAPGSVSQLSPPALDEYVRPNRGQQISIAHRQQPEHPSRNDHVRRRGRLP